MAKFKMEYVKKEPGKPVTVYSVTEDTMQAAFDKLDAIVGKQIDLTNAHELECFEKFTVEKV